MQNSKGIMRQRSALVEHPFGTLKRRAGWDHFLMRGLEKSQGEFSLMAENVKVLVACDEN
jgi:hypothetical protein